MNSFSDGKKIVKKSLYVPISIRYVSFFAFLSPFAFMYSRLVPLEVQR